MKRHRGKTIWFSGLSGSGKSTLSSLLNTILESRGVPVVLLDGDLLRSGLSCDLGFSQIDRAENIRRAGEVAKILSEAGHTVIAAFITPMESLRAAVRGLFEPDRYVEIFLDCPLEVCEKRDPKGLYCRARAGDIPDFTGISSPFELPSAPELAMPTGRQTVEESLGLLVSFLETRFPDLRCDLSQASRKIRTDQGRKVMVIGLDGVPPSLVFNRGEPSLINLRALMGHGVWGPLRSTDPPITVPAWTTMTTGKDPGELGLYGFRNRLDHGYGPMVTVHSSHVKARRVWEYLEESGRRSILVGLPQTYPPVPHNGITVAGFLTPGIDAPFTYPPDLADELHLRAGGQYMTDVPEFRTDDKDRLLKDLYTMVERRFRVAYDFLIHEPWDFFMMVEIGTDRLHHGFWNYCNADHPLYEPGNPYETVIPDFYRYLDAWIGSLLATLSDDTTVIVVSDHGSRNLLGGIHVNEWLIREGLLVLQDEPRGETRLTPELVDWTRTKVWSEGGYYARIFVNVTGREPSGTVAPSEYDAFLDQLTNELQAIEDEQGRPMATRVLKPEAIYRTCTNVPPDLIVYFDDLNRRSIGTVGTGKIISAGNDTGPDNANHDPEGIFIMTRMADLRSGTRNGQRVDHATLLDITPTILHEMGSPVPAGMGGTVINKREWETRKPISVSAAHQERKTDRQSRVGSTEGYTAEEEEIIRKRLEDLGYL